TTDSVSAASCPEPSPEQAPSRATTGNQSINLIDEFILIILSRAVERCACSFNDSCSPLVQARCRQLRARAIDARSAHALEKLARFSAERAKRGAQRRKCLSSEQTSVCSGETLIVVAAVQRGLTTGRLLAALSAHG